MQPSPAQLAAGALPPVGSDGAVLRPHHFPPGGPRKLSEKVKGDYKRDLRQSWLDRALENEISGLDSQSDIYLIEWLLVGDCKIFFEKLVDGVRENLGLPVGFLDIVLDG